MTIGIALVVEGYGDVRSVPALVTRILHEHQVFDVTISRPPIRSGGLVSLQRHGELERFVELALRKQGADGVLVVLDCDDDCAAEVAVAFASRINPLARRYERKVGVTFMVREYESLMLAGLASIPSIAREPESIRGAKERLLAATGGSYGETVDQERLTYQLDFQLLRPRHRSFHHLESTLLWLIDRGALRPPYTRPA